MIQLNLYSRADWQKDLNDFTNVTLLNGYYPEAATDQDNPVTETINLLVRGSTHDEMVDNVREINLLLDYARKNTSGPQGAWLEFAMDENQEVWRARLYDGAMNFNGKLLHQWREKKVVISLVIERSPDWLGPEAQLALTNANGTDNTSGLVIWNHDDSGSGHDNFVSINGDDVEGDLPAPCRIEITNTYNSATHAYTYYIGHNWQSDPLNLATVLEGENADHPTTGNSNSSAMSGGAYKTLALPATDGYMARWDLAAATLAKCKGNYFRLMAVFGSSPPGGTWLRAKLSFPAGTPLTVVYESPAVLLSDSAILQEIGVIQLPPWLPGETGLADISLALYGYNAAEGNLLLDYIQLFALDGYRKLVPAGYGLPYTTTLVDDQISGSLYQMSGTAKAGYYIGTGEIRLQPGQDQRLHILCTSATQAAPIERTATVKVYYRPRRASL